MYDNTAGILNYRGSGVQNTCRIFSPYHSGVENTCRIFMQYPSVVQNTCRIVMLHLSAVGNTGLLFQLWRVPGCRGVLHTPHRRPYGAEYRSCCGMFWGTAVGNTDTFSIPGTRHPSEYGHVFATYGWRLWGVCCCVPTAGYMSYIKIRTCFRHLRVAFVGRMQYAPTAGYMPYIKIRTRFCHLRAAFVGRMQYAPTAGYTCWFGIRIRFPNPIRTTYRKTHPIFQHLADGGNHDREVWPTFGAVHFKNNVLKTYL